MVQMCQERQLTKSFFLSIFLCNRAYLKHAWEYPCNTALKRRQLWRPVLNHREPVKKSMRKFEKSHDLIIIGGYIGERLNTSMEKIANVLSNLGIQYLRYLCKGRKDQAGWHGRGKGLWTISIYCHQTVRKLLLLSQGLPTRHLQQLVLH